LTVLTVWAPRASELAVEVGGRREPMAACGERPGWYAAATALAHGTDYLLVVDGEAVPDPAARWSPGGVHGPSRVLDPSVFSWHDHGWAGAPLDGRSLVYEIHIGTFTREGTLSAAAGKLAHLSKLGVTHIELMPLAAFDGTRGWGYDGVQLNAVHEPYGGPFALAEFVDLAHCAGIAVLLDVVHNHLGPSGNYWDLLAPILSDAHRTPWGGAVNLDGPGSSEVRSILIGSALGWLEDFHLDGLRLDAVHELRDASATPYLRELSEQVTALATRIGRPLALVAESDHNDPRTVAEAHTGGLGMTAQWDDDVHHGLHWVLTGESDGYYRDFASCAAAAYALEHAFLHDGRWSSFRGRVHGHSVDFDRTPPTRFVTSLQTHDQVGNRACGDRLTHLVGADRAAAGAALLLALPYVPMLFMGQEWGARTPWCFFAGFADSELARAVTEGRREEFARHGWASEQVPDPQDPDTFHGSTLDWRELDTDAAQRMLAWHARLSDLRRTRSSVPAAPEVFWEQDPTGRPRWWGVLSGQRFTVANLDPSNRVAVDLEPSDGAEPSVLASWRGDYATSTADQLVSLTLGAGETVIVDGVRTCQTRTGAVEQAGRPCRSTPDVAGTGR